MTIDISPILAITYQTLLVVTLIVVVTSIRPSQNIEKTECLILTFGEIIDYKTLPKWIFSIVNMSTIFQLGLIKPATGYWFFNNERFKPLIDESRYNLVGIVSKNMAICGCLAAFLGYMEIMMSGWHGNNLEQVLLSGLL